MFLKFGECLHANLQAFLSAGLVFGTEMQRVSRINVLKAKFFALRDLKWLGKVAGHLEDFLEVHSEWVLSFRIP